MKRLYKYYSTCDYCGRRYGHEGNCEDCPNKCPICTKGRKGIIGALKVLAKRIPKNPNNIKIKTYPKPEPKGYEKILTMKEIEEARE